MVAQDDAKSTQSGVRAWASTTARPLASPAFRAFWCANLVSNFGGVIQGVGAAWLMLSLTPSPDMVALVQTAGSLPLMLFSPAAGALADIMDRRKLMIGALLISSLGSALLGLMTLAGVMTPWLLLGLTFLVGAGAAFTIPAWQASVVDLAPVEQLPQAIALNSLNFNVARSVGPALGAELIAVAGAVGAFLANALSYVWLITVVALWRPPQRSGHLPRETLGRAMADGVRFVSLSPAIRAMMMRGFLFTFAGIALLALLPVAAKALGEGPRTLGVLLAAFGLGAMAGALLSARLRQSLSADGVVTAATACLGLALLGLAFSPWLAASLLCVAAAGAAWVLTLSSLNVSVQISSPRWVAGRAIAVYGMVVFAGMAIGSAVWGVAAREAGLSATFAMAGAFLLASLALAGRLRLPEPNRGDLEPRAMTSRPTPEEMDPRAGPIVVLVEHRVDPANALAFRAAAEALGRIRRRDGARSWTLMQDIDDPTLWIERYHSPTWADHLRRIARPIAADEQVRATVAGLSLETAHTRRLLEQPSDDAMLGRARPGVSDHSQNA
jgi:MFS family permease